MKEFNITSSDAGRRLDKFILNILGAAPASFAYKMLRKKNIVLNGRKASGNEILEAGDTVRFYLSDDTFEKFSRKSASTADIGPAKIPPIIYEDEDVIIVNKPSGMLSQRSSSDDISLNEILRSYAEKDHASDKTDTTFSPAVCNRLDRNTSGLVTFAKTYRAAKYLSEAFRDHTLGKYYKCVNVGVIDKKMTLTGKLIKDPSTNTVTISGSESDGSSITTIVTPVRNNGRLTLSRIELITGKTHQIRAHMAYIGHPILGDVKYGDRKINSEYRKGYGITSQLLVCDKLVIPDDFKLEGIVGRTFEIALPEEFERVM